MLSLLLFLGCFSLYKIKEVEAEEEHYFIDVSLSRSYRVRGQTIDITALTNSTNYLLQIYLPNGSLYHNQTHSANTTYSFSISSDASYGNYIAKAIVPNQVSTAWFWVQKVDDLVPFVLPYNWAWKGINYSIQSNFTLSVRGFDGSFNLDWLSEIFAKFKPSVSVCRNEYLIFIKTLGKDIDCDHWLMLQHKGLKIRLNGTVASPTTLKWNFKNTVNLQLAWILSGLKVGHLVYDWSDFDSTGVSYEWDKTNLKCNVYLETSFDVDPYIFEDGFESNDFSAWTGTGGVAPNITSSVVHHGSYAENASGTGFDHSYVYKTFGASYSPIYVRAYVRWVTNPGNDGAFDIISAIGDDAATRVSGGVKNDGGTMKWVLGYRNDTSASWETRLNATDTPQVNTWYCIEIKAVVNDTVGEARLYVDGVEKAAVTGVDNGHNEINQIRAGEYRLSANPLVVYIIYVDCVVADTSYIGLEASNTAPTIGEFTCDSTVYANRYSFVNATIDDDDGVADFQNCTIQLNGTIQLKWVNNTNTFSELTDSSNYCTLDASNSVKTSVNGTAVKLSWKVKLYWNYTEGSIFINGTVWDDEPTSGTASETSIFTFEDDLTVSSVSHSPFEPETGSTFTITGYLYYYGTTSNVEDSSGVTVYLFKQGWQIDTTTSITSGQWSFSHSEAEANVYYYEVYAETDETTSEVTEEVNVIKGGGTTPITPTPVEPTEPVTPVEPVAPIAPTPGPQPVFQLPFSPLYIMVGLIVVVVVATAYQIQTKPTLKSAKKKLRKKGLPSNTKFKKVKRNKKMNNVFGNTTTKKKKKVEWKKKKLWD